MANEINKDKNLNLWKMVEKTNPKYTRKFQYTNGKELTTIDAYYQIKVATATWGSYGSKWGFKNISITQVGNTALYKAVFYYPEGEFEIINSISINERDFAKKLETDTLTKALSRLGFNADIFMGKFDDSKYVESLKHSKPKSTPESTKQKPQTLKPADDSEQTDPMPSASEIANALKQHGLSLVIQNDVYIVEGKTYQKKDVIKSLGFRYSSERKAWWKKAV